MHVFLCKFNTNQTIKHYEEGKMTEYEDEINFFREYDNLLDFHLTEINKMAEIIRNQNDYIKTLEEEKYKQQKDIELKIYDNISIHSKIFAKYLDSKSSECNRYKNELKIAKEKIAELIKKNHELDVIGSLLKERYNKPVKLYKGIILDEEKTLKIEKTSLTCPSGSTKDFNFRFLSECPDVKESSEYKKIEEKFKNSLARIEGLGHVICDRDAEIKKQQDFIWLLNSKKSEYIDKYLYLKEQIQLVMNATAIQRINKKNSKGVSYDEIKLEPQE